MKRLPVRLFTYLKRHHMAAPMTTTGDILGSLQATEILDWKRRRWRFSLLAMLVVVGMICLVLGLLEVLD